ncbi:MAG: GNAT family N-acetyltransferase [Chloroflexi bacterium]|nr:GNAT family N-acetyltransferase [Chloroflexota bacterium]
MTKLWTKEPLLSSTLNLRAVKWADLNAVAKLIYDVCEADGDTTVAVTPEELKHEWENDDFNLETDAFVVETKEGRVVGYEELGNQNEHAHLRADGYVHPAFKGLGIGTSLLRRMEARAHEEMELAAPGPRVFIQSAMDSKDEEGRNLHKNEGYIPVRYHWRMEIKLEDAPPVPVWPEGVELRPFIREQHERAVWQAQNESFRDHWGSRDVTFEEFTHSRFDDPEYDPSLWAIAWDGDEVAGVSLNRFRMGIGWIRTLGVRRPWRKKGLGLALLQHSFGEFYRRGMKTIGLGVDASNPTGATRLYKRAGMYAASEFVTYEKELHPGRELETQ